MLFNIPDEELSISESENAVCEGKVECPMKSEFKQVDCCDCPFNLTKYKVEGKNPIFQKVYDKYKDRISTGKKSVEFINGVSLKQWVDIVGDLWKAIKTYMEDGE